MAFLNYRAFRVGLLCAAVLALLVNVWLFRVAPEKEAQAAQRRLDAAIPFRPSKIPAGGIADNDTHGQVPGNPSQTVAAMHRLYEAIKVYRSRHNGTIVEQGGDNLPVDIVMHFKQYGFATFEEALAFIRNPDMKYADSAVHSTQPEVTFPYHVVSVRPDGTPPFGIKEDGQRDALLFTDMYFHRNIRTFTGDKTTTKPVGFYLVLWDDGEVQQVPYQQVQFLTQQGNAHSPEVFEGQAGIPAGNALPYDEYQKWRQKNY